MATATRTLRECLEDLPQEIYDEIYALTFAMPFGGQIVVINKSYKPLAVAQVNRAARKAFKLSCMSRCFVAELEDLIPWLKVQESRRQWANLRCWSAKYLNRPIGETWLAVRLTLDHYFDKSVGRRLMMFRNEEDVSTPCILQNYER